MRSLEFSSCSKLSGELNATSLLYKLMRPFFRRCGVVCDAPAAVVVIRVDDDVPAIGTVVVVVLPAAVISAMPLLFGLSISC